MSKFFLTTFLLAFALFFPAFAQSGQEWRLKVSLTSLEYTRNEEAAPFLILLSEQADVNGAKLIYRDLALAGIAYI
jgi:hypothetical protein